MAGHSSYVEFASRPSEPSGSQASPTLVLLHAFPLHAGMWAPQRPLADAGLRVVMPNVRGFGGAADAAPAASIDTYAEDVIGLLNHLRIERAIIGGVSMGGYIALALYRLAPERLSGLVLADTRADADAEPARANRRRLIALVESSGAAAIASDMVPRLLGSTTQAERPELTKIVHDMICENPVPAIQAALTAMLDRADSTPLLPTLTVPTLVLVGDEDVLTPPALSEAMANAVPGAQLVRIPGAGHLTNLEQPQAFNEAVTACFAGR